MPFFYPWVGSWARWGDYSAGARGSCDHHREWGGGGFIDMTRYASGCAEPCALPNAVFLGLGRNLGQAGDYSVGLGGLATTILSVGVVDSLA